MAETKFFFVEYYEENFQEEIFIDKIYVNEEQLEYLQNADGVKDLKILHENAFVLSEPQLVEALGSDVYAVSAIGQDNLAGILVEGRISLLENFYEDFIKYLL